MSARISSADAELIHSLENAFATHAGSDGLIDLPELQKALGLQDERVARRVLRAFARSAPGSPGLDRKTPNRIDSRAFLAAVRALVAGDERERLAFAFRLVDDDADGSITEPEMLRMIAIGAGATTLSKAASQSTDELAHTLFRAADRDGDGRLSFEELARALRKHPRLLQRLTRSEALWIAPNEALLQAGPAKTAAKRLNRPRRNGLLRTLDNHRYDLLATGLWLLGNLALFIYYVSHTPAANGVPGASWVRLARAFAACLSLNASLVFLPVMRHLIARVRQTWWGQRVDIDRAMQAHRILGHVILGLAWAHAIAYALAFQSGHHALGISRMLSGTYHGRTGALLLSVFTGLWTIALLGARRLGRVDNAYRVYGVLMALLVVHAPGFALWLIVPLLGLCYELLSRRRKRSRQALVHELTPLRSGVTRITIERPAAFRFEAGSYLFLNLPQIAQHVWHPLTVTSPPEQSDLTLHVRNENEWTVRLRAAAEARARRADNAPWLAHIDGPHGRSSARVFHVRNAVLIGAGNGVIPLASILASIVTRTSGPVETDCDLRTLQFFWLNQDQQAYEWLTAQLGEQERAPVRIPIGVHICLTAGRTGATSTALEIARELSVHDGATAAVRAKTHTGHPDWRIVLTAIADKHAPEPVEVFFSGPPGLGLKLRAHCAHIGMRFHEEKF